MKPILIKLEQFSEEPGNNYLQFLFSFAVTDGTTDIYFIKDKHNVRVFRNVPGAVVIEPSELEEILDLETWERISNFQNSFGLSPINMQKGFYEEIPLPYSMLKKLEKAFKDIYRLRRIRDLNRLSGIREIIIGETRVLTGLAKIPKNEGYGFHIKINYKH